MTGTSLVPFTQQHSTTAEAATGWWSFAWRTLTTPRGQLLSSSFFDSSSGLVTVSGFEAWTPRAVLPLIVASGHPVIRNITYLKPQYRQFRFSIDKLDFLFLLEFDVENLPHLHVTTPISQAGEPPFSPTHTPPLECKPYSKSVVEILSSQFLPPAILRCLDPCMCYKDPARLVGEA